MRLLGAGLLTGLCVTVALGIQEQDDFPHEEHARLFPTCETCHALTPQGEPRMPAAVSCSSCHDGDVEETVDWAPPERMASLLVFNHSEHTREALEEGDSTSCASCHGDTANWEVLPADVATCGLCHADLDDHPDGAGSCSDCHVTLAESRISTQQVAALPTPVSHADGFAMEHDAAIDANPASCATCHAREFCVQCHVNAPETPEIQRLAPDERSLAIAATVPTPATHNQHDFVLSHESAELASCATCHTRESCTDCHVSDPSFSRVLYAAGPGRSPGPSITRDIPASHGPGFISGLHGVDAAADPGSCATCHVRSDCLDCHRPDASSDGQYHPVGFVSLHPAESYRRASSCADCHSTSGFCQSCHESSGLTGDGALDAGFHDAKAAFGIGHGPAARQSLESCVTCHVEQDCLACHSIISGRGFNPHGPGFDAERLRSKNFESCTVCHGSTVPSDG